MQIEKWLPTRYPGVEVSNRGRARKGERILSSRIRFADRLPSILVQGANGSNKRKSLALLIAEAFLPRPSRNSRLQVKDGDPTNLAVDNLEWGVISHPGPYSEKIITRVVKLHQGERSLTEISKLTGITISGVSKIVKRWKDGRIL